MTFTPVLELASGRVVGAEVLASEAVSGANAFAFGPPADEGWWLAAAVRPAQVPALLETSGLPAARLVLTISPLGLTHAVRSGQAASLRRLGVRLIVPIGLGGFVGGDPDDLTRLRTRIAVARSWGAEVVGRDVDTAEQLAVAGDAGVALVSGYWWGSPGSLAKLVGTWARTPVSG